METGRGDWARRPDAETRRHWASNGMGRKWSKDRLDKWREMDDQRARARGEWLRFGYGFQMKETARCQKEAIHVD